LRWQDIVRLQTLCGLALAELDPVFEISHTDEYTMPI
jgi:hypothetical protein